MFERLKRTLVDSYVGAIGLGWMMSQIVLHSVSVIASPFSGWLMRREMGTIADPTRAIRGFSIQDAIPELTKTVLILLIWYGLLRWLYYKPIEQVDVGE